MIGLSPSRIIIYLLCFCNFAVEYNQTKTANLITDIKYEKVFINIDGLRGTFHDRMLQ